MVYRGAVTFIAVVTIFNFAEALNSHTNGSPRPRRVLFAPKEKTKAIPRITSEEREGKKQSEKMARALGRYDIEMCLPSRRNEVGTINFGGHSCKVKGKGITSNRKIRKGDTPTGVYNVIGLGGNSRGQWGMRGLQIIPTWSGNKNQRGEIGRGNSTTDLFIHTRASVQKDSDLAGRSSWGCPLIPWNCMKDLTKFYQSGGSRGVTLNIKDGC